MLNIKIDVINRLKILIEIIIGQGEMLIKIKLLLILIFF